MSKAEKALAIVNKATKLSYKDIGTKELNLILTALRAIAPGGPLVVVPREHFKQLADRECGAHCAGVLVHEQRHSDFCNKTRAMIAEGEK